MKRKFFTFAAVAMFGFAVVLSSCGSETDAKSDSAIIEDLAKEIVKEAVKVADSAATTTPTDSVPAK